MFLWHLPLLSLLVTALSLEIDYTSREDLSDGEKLYGALVKKAISYGDCWKRAVSDLHLNCKRLTEEIQSRLALSFSNCFLIQAGLEPCHCDADVPISDCLKNSDDRVFGTYREFFTHTHSICHYLQHREWQEEASNAVLALIENSQSVSKKLDESSKSQSKILELQQTAVNEQKRLILSGRTLRAELQQSKESARDMYREFRMVTDEQKFLLFQVFDRLKNLQSFVLGEFSGVYTIIYHIIMAVLIYIFTSVPQTTNARMWLILVMLLGAVCERILTTFALQEDTLDVNPQSINELLYNRIWFCRKTVCFICLIILMVTYHRYKDYNIINYQLLQEIQLQNKEVLNLLSVVKGLNLHENVPKFSASINNLTNYSSIVYDADRKATAAEKTDIVEKESRNVISIINTPILQKISENKENIPLNSTPKEDLTSHLKKRISKKEVSEKKKTCVRKQDDVSKVLSPHERSLSELNSPVSKRYNLRSSSKLCSPDLSPISKTSPRETFIS